MAETFTGTVAEVGGKEMSKDGTKEKPRKVVVKDDPSKQFGKTFRVWPNSSDFDALRAAADSGSLVTVEYEVNQIPGTDYTQNMIVNVLEGSDGAGAPPQGNGTPPVDNSSAPSDTSWTAPDTWSTPPPTRRDETTRQIEAAWSITNAIALLGDKAQDQDQVHTVAHQLLVMKHRVAQEIE